MKSKMVRKLAKKMFGKGWKKRIVVLKVTKHDIIDVTGYLMPPGKHGVALFDELDPNTE